MFKLAQPQSQESTISYATADLHHRKLALKFGCRLMRLRFTKV